MTALTDAQRRAGNLRGAFWMMISAIGATGMLSVVRVLIDMNQGSPETLSFLRTALGLWVTAIFLIDGRLFTFRFPKLGVLILRGAATGLAITLAFIGVARLPLATVSIFLFMAPVFATALAGPLFGEHVGWRRWLAVIAGFTGALIIIRPGAAPLEFGAIAALGGALAFSFALLLTKKVSDVASVPEILLSTVLFASIAVSPVALINWSPPSSAEAWLWIIALVGFSSLRMYADISAYAVGEAGFIAPFSYLRLIFAVVVGYYAFGETLDMWTWLGGAVIIGSTLYIALRGGASASA